MTNAATLSIANRSLLSIGARAQIGSLNENSTEANAINTLFVPTFESLARTAAWNCLRQQATLTLLAAAAGTPENLDGLTLPLPPSPYLYMYAMPNDSLQVRYLLPNYTDSNSGSPPMTPASISANSTFFGAGQIYFEVAFAKDSQQNPISVILTNQSQAQVVYTINQPNPTTWDSLFQAAMVASLAAYLVPALSLNLPLMDRSIKAADAMIATARARDGNEGVVTQNRQADWMRARVTGGGTGLTNYGAAMNGYGGMIWPVG